jgi:hypothetical protein
MVIGFAGSMVVVDSAVPARLVGMLNAGEAANASSGAWRGG